MTLKIKVYNNTKYLSNEKVCETIYKDVVGIEVRFIEDEEIRAMGYDEFDPYKEYCIITFENGETITLRNSFVDVFRER